MKQNKFLQITIWILIVFGSLSFSSCNKEKIENASTLKKLYSMYKDGQIDECMWKGQKVYNAGKNAIDAGTFVYDAYGNAIGQCSYGWNNVDEICDELTNCETIYRVEDNVWKMPAVDKYNLGK